MENKFWRDKHGLLEKNIIVAHRPGLKIFRIDPPLNITKQEMDHFISQFEKVLEITDYAH
ncbi:MAG: hypothetical protein GY729_21890 [Desulfobacteraceae bacterium]|nr:hypothetical protein [Desulfobacteraceae bacterium]